MADDAWIARSTAGDVLSYGDGPIPLGVLEMPGVVMSYHADYAAAEADAQIVTIAAQEELLAARDYAISQNRKQAFVRKEANARAFIADEPDTNVAGDPSVIDSVLYSALFKEYQATHTLLPAGYTPWDLARDIIIKADEEDDVEAQRRVVILTAENSQAVPESS